MVDRSAFTLGIRPLLRLIIIFGIVAFYHAVVEARFSGVTQLGVLVGLSFVTWILVAKFIFEPFVETLNL